MDPLLPSDHEYFQESENGFDKRNWQASLNKNIVKIDFEIYKLN